MDERNNNGSGDGFLDFGVYILAIGLYIKTMDLLSYFAPKVLDDILGFNTSYVYGAVMALLVEGVAIAIHRNPRAAKHAPAQITKWLLIAISAICQIFDGYKTTNALVNMSDTLKIGFTYGVPLIPVLGIVLLFWIGKLPSEGMQKTRKQFKGFKTLPRRVGDWFMNGSAGTTTNATTNAPQTTNALASTAPQPKLVPANGNQNPPKNNNKPINPTQGGQGKP